MGIQKKNKKCNGAGENANNFAKTKKQKMSLQSQNEISELNRKKDIEEKRLSNKLGIKMQELKIEIAKIIADAGIPQDRLRSNSGGRNQKSYHNKIKVPIF